MTSEQTQVKCEEMRVYFRRVIEKAVKEKVKLLSGWYFLNSCNCLVTHAFPSDGENEINAIDESLDKVTQFFFQENYACRRGLTEGGNVIQTLIDGWDSLGNEEPVADDKHEIVSLESEYFLSFDLGKELRYYYLELGGIV